MARTSTGKSSKYQFATIPSVSAQRSQLDLSHGHKTTFNEGKLIPIEVLEVLPGDTINLRTTSFCRMQEALYPVMDNMYLDFFWFFVPNRLVWVNWKKFCGEQVDPGDSTDYTIPVTTDTSIALYDNGVYMGIPYVGS